MTELCRIMGVGVLYAVLHLTHIKRFPRPMEGKHACKVYRTGGMYCDASLSWDW